MTPAVPLPAASPAIGNLSARRRLQRTAIAVATTLVAMLMFYLTYLAGFIPAQVFVIAGGAALALMALFVPVFYSGINQRFRDPSLFLPQTMCAACQLLRSHPSACGPAWHSNSTTTQRMRWPRVIGAVLKG